ncbi:MAG: alpha/beta fold hydrolase [Rhodoferax sp.]|nr:alpha/beta fold hydrolase [Rhodoferax sp.]
MRSVVFGRCRGWLDLPPPDTTARGGIILFGPYGPEALTTRYSLARLAVMLAERGHVVLRFDLPGTGDSLGDWNDIDLMSAWVDSGRTAVEQLKIWCKVEAITLIGLRVGGTVAAQVAQALLGEGRPVQGLALLGVAVQGRQYVRELQALTNNDPVLRFAGFPMSEALQSDLSAIDLRAFAGAPAQRVFMAVASESRAQTTLDTQWALGAAVTRVAYPDMVRHLGESTTNYLPVALFDQLAQWCAPPEPVDRDHVAPSCDPPSLPYGDDLPSRAFLSGPGFVEHAVAIAATVPLTAVWCDPEAFDEPKVVVVFSSSGRNPHVGGARMWVRLARQLAVHGIANLRFDLAGMGDSPPAPDAPEHLIYHSSGIPQLRSVVDHVETRYPAAKICLVGVCSGGFLAFHEAVGDHRVAGLMIVNLQCYEWHDGMSLEQVAHLQGKSTTTYRQLLMDPQTWTRLLQGRVNIRYLLGLVVRKLLSRVKIRWAEWRQQAKGHIGLAADESVGTGPYHGLDLIRRGFTSLSSRGTQTVVLYGDADVGLDVFFSYFGRGGRRFQKVNHAKLSLQKDFDHDLHGEMAQNTLLNEVLILCKTCDKSIILGNDDLCNQVF